MLALANTLHGVSPCKIHAVTCMYHLPVDACMNTSGTTCNEINYVFICARNDDVAREMYHHDHRCVAIFISNRNHPHFAVAKLRAQPHQNIPPWDLQIPVEKMLGIPAFHSQTNTSEKYLMYTMGLQNPGWTSKVQNMWIKKMTVPWASIQVS